MTIQNGMEWDTLEHRYIKKTNDWYASVIVIAGAVIAVEFLVGNFVLIMLTLIGTIAFLLLVARQPNMMHVEIIKKGIRAGNTLYPFSDLDGFAIAEYEHERRLLLESNRQMVPLYIVPIASEIDADNLREVLSEYIPEKDLREPIPYLLFERLGF